MDSLVNANPGSHHPLAVGAVVAAVAALSGYAATTWAKTSMDTTMLPWIVARGLGVAAYLALTGLTALGLWLRHPLRIHVRWPTPTVLLWSHATLAAATLLLLVGHVLAVVADSFAGVGWSGALVPGLSHYRPFAVGLGVVSVYLGVLAAASVGLAGRLFGRRWLGIHRLSSAVFVLAWLHGLLAGSDTTRLRVLYVVTGAAVGLLLLTRRLMPVAPAMTEKTVRA